MRACCPRHRRPRRGKRTRLEARMVLVLLITLTVLLLLFGAIFVSRPPASAADVTGVRVPDDASLKSRLQLTGLLLAAAAASITYRAILNHGLQQTAALFLAVPLILAIVVIL